MSGGHYDYAYRNLNNMADEIDRDLATGVFANPDHIEPVVRFMSQLRTDAGLAKELEWAVDGDTNMERFVSAFSAVHDTQPVLLDALLEILGWQGGTIWDALAEVKRLKMKVKELESASNNL